MGVPVTPDPLLTVAEVSEWLGLTADAIRGLVQRRAIPFRKAGKALRFDRLEIEAWTKPAAVGRDVLLTHATTAPRTRRKAGEGSLLTPKLKSLGYR